MIFLKVKHEADEGDEGNSDEIANERLQEEKRRNRARHFPKIIFVCFVLFVFNHFPQSAGDAPNFFPAFVIAAS